jgi:hypothetical protein
MWKNKIIGLIVSVVCNLYTYGQNNISKEKDTIMHKTIDFQFLEEKAVKEPLLGQNMYEYSLKYEDENGSFYKIFGNKEDGFVEWETPPLPLFYKNYSEYYENGIMKLTGKVIGNGSVRIGVWEYFDENGNKTKEVNEDAKYGAFDYNKVLIFFHLKEFINLETGENREHLSLGYSEEEKRWIVSISNKLYIITEYQMDGETGDIISTRTYQGGQE